MGKNIYTRNLSFEIINMDRKSTKRIERAGVWMLLGKNESDEKYHCLQVAQKKDIYSEMESDIFLMKNSEVETYEKPYFNFFGEELDEVSIITYPNAREQLYSQIAALYDELTIVVLISGYIGEIARKQIEKYVAVKTKARFWRNGRPYEKKVMVNLDDIDLRLDMEEIGEGVIERIDQCLDKYVYVYKKIEPSL